MPIEPKIIAVREVDRAQHPARNEAQRCQREPRHNAERALELAARYAQGNALHTTVGRAAYPHQMRP